MKKRLLALLLAGLMVMSLAACGSDAQEETTGEETGTDGQDFGGAELPEQADGGEERPHRGCCHADQELC